LKFHKKCQVLQATLSCGATKKNARKIIPADPRDSVSRSIFLLGLVSQTGLTLSQDLALVQLEHLCSFL